MKLDIPEFTVVVLIGASGSGKSTFARKHFLPTEIVSSDICRGLVSDDENDQAATGDAFDLLYSTLDIRLKRRKLTVVDATNVRAEDRKRVITLAKKWHTLPTAIVINPGEDVCHERNKSRPDRDFGPHVVRNQTSALRRSLRGLKREGFGHVYILETAEEIASATVSRMKLWTDKREEKGPFDIIGDVHGCCDELEALLQKLGYAISTIEEQGHGLRYSVTPPEGRKAVFVGDIVDRGPRTGDSLRLVMDMMDAGAAHCVVGNHEAKAEKWLSGRDVKIAHGLAQTIEELNAGGDAFKARVKKFIGGLRSHYMLDGGRLAVAHAGIKEEMQNRASSAIRAFCMYGETTGETDEFGLPVRHNWAAEYRGDTRVVYGHTPVLETEWLNNTLCIDTGCVFGGKLTALRYPEMELVSEPARKIYCEPARPLAMPAGLLTAQQERDVTSCINAGLAGGNGFAVDASLIAADANKCRSTPGDEWSREIDPATARRAVRDYLANLDEPAWGAATGVVPKFIAPADPAAQWTSALRNAAFFAYADNYLIDAKFGIIMDVEASRAIRQAETGASQTMIGRTGETFGIKPDWLVADTAYGSAPNLHSLAGKKGIEPHVPVIEKSQRDDGTFSRSDFTYDADRDVYICPNGKVLPDKWATARRWHVCLLLPNLRLQELPLQTSMLCEDARAEDHTASV